MEQKTRCTNFFEVPEPIFLLVSEKKGYYVFCGTIYGVGNLS
jgi:hypothetical protein